MAWRGLQIFLLVALFGTAKSARCKRDPMKLNVHVVCHTHDDVGWLKTVDQYYWGARQDIQVAGVQYILDAVVAALETNTDRRFVYAEIAFFERWWAQQDEDMRARVTQLVQGGQLEFVNGGYVQHDEAAAHYVAMVDQTTRGHAFLKTTFDVAPRVAWQIDPFGHSSTQASLLSAEAGFDALFFGRADYQDIEKRRNESSLEMVWRSSTSLPGADVFTGIFYYATYGPLPGFWWEWASTPDDPIMDDPRLKGYNVQDRVEQFVAECMEMANATRGNDIMLTMGSDFQYPNAHAWYKNLDKLIHYVNEDGRLNAFYSTPREYVEAKHAYGARWPLKTDDFMPYADYPNAYWSGYFTSRAASKGLIRKATSYLQAARQLEAFVGLKANGSGPTTDNLEEAVSLCQHHDAISGTARQHVADDYDERIYYGLTRAAEVALGALKGLINAAKEAAPGRPQMAELRRLQAVPLELETPVDLSACWLTNVTICGPSVSATREGSGFNVVVYNPVAWTRPAHVSIPIDTSATCIWLVKDFYGKVVPSQVLPLDPVTKNLQQLMVATNASKSADAGNVAVVFSAEVPPLGYASYKLEPGPAATPCVAPAPHNPGVDGKDIVLGNGPVELTFSSKTGSLVSAAIDGTLINLATDFLWYNASDGLESQSNRGQSSGVYIFRPNGCFKLASEPTKLKIVEGEVISEARQEFADWAMLITRLYKGQRFIEFEWTVGPIPINDGMGKEVVLRYTSNIASGSTVMTDSNGREMLRRTLNQRPTWELNVTEPVAGNYYPITAAIAVDDGVNEMAVLIDRAQGGASLRDGEIELMLHRRTLVDDRRGMGESLNETMCGCIDCECSGLVVRGRHWVTFSGVEDSATNRRRLQQLLNDQPIIAVGHVPPESVGSLSLTGGLSLPQQLHLLTLKATSEKNLLLRIAHLFEASEPGGGEVEFDVMELMGALQVDVVEVQELSLTTNRLRSDLAGRLRFTAEGEETLPSSEHARTNCSSASCCIIFKPMEIRTFEVLML